MATVIIRLSAVALVFSGLSRCGAYSRAALIKKFDREEQNHFKSSDIFFLYWYIYVQTNKKCYLHYPITCISSSDSSSLSTFSMHGIVAASPTSDSSGVKGSTRTSDKMLAWVFSISRPFSHVCSLYCIRSAALIRGQRLFQFLTT